jgi:putative hemolysin
MFTIMIIMAIVTTCITAPSVHLLYRNRRDELVGDDDALPACQQDVNGDGVAICASASCGAQGGRMDDVHSAACQQDMNGVSPDGAADCASASCGTQGGCMDDVHGAADKSGGGGGAAGERRKDAAGNGVSTAV